MQAAAAAEYVASQPAAVEGDISVAEGDWLDEGVLDEKFHVGYGYTCAVLLK